MWRWLWRNSLSYFALFIYFIKDNTHQFNVSDLAKTLIFLCSPWAGLFSKSECTEISFRLTYCACVDFEETQYILNK